LEDAAAKIRSRKYVYISAFSHAVNRYVNIISRQSKSNRNSIAVLTQLIIQGGILHPTELARLMWMPKYSMTKIIDNLEESGLVVRHRVEEDRRAILIKVTSYGLEFMKETLNNHDLLWKNVIDSLSKREQEELISLLQKMVRSFPQDVINAHIF
jgi:DNA-binding MarR family transcriptional regulator